jgi:hypothetical protein
MVRGIITICGWIGLGLGGIAAVLGLLHAVTSIGPTGSFGFGLVAFLNGALLIGLAQLIGEVQKLGRQLDPLHRIGQVLAPRYAAAVAAQSGQAAAAPAAAEQPPASLDEIITSPPANAQVYANGNFRVVLMSDGSVVAQTPDGVRSFGTLDEYKTSAGLA